MKYFYARVSSTEQNLDRQIASFEQYGANEANTFSDKRSGKDFDRPEYIRLKETLRPGDELYVKSLDRLGRNKDAVRDELAWFKAHGVILRILDLPTSCIEAPPGQEWVIDMVNNILLEVLSSMAEHERDEIKARQADGIAAMPVVEGRRISRRTGRAYGRPQVDMDEKSLKAVYEKQRTRKISPGKAAETLGVSVRTYYNLLERYGLRPA
jgi:DNA invertase Pin-like site-specific DNA recombinase